MKEGRTIESLAAELTRIQDSKRDLIVPTAKMQMEDGNIILESGDSFRPSGWAHQQLATYANIPKAYYDRLLADTELKGVGVLSQCVNHGFQTAINQCLARKTAKHDARLLRTMDGSIRGFLSDRYRRLDCFDLLETVFPVLVDKQFKVVSSQLTERRMYVKALTDKIQGDIKVGHVAQFGVAISSSDVGCGSVRIEPLIYELVCKNGMIMNTALRKFHIGRSQAEDDITELLSDETKDLTDKAFWHQVRDVLVGSMKEDIFEANLNKLREAAKAPIKKFDIPEVVDLSMKEVGITSESTKNSIVNYLANGASGRGMNKWALANAFTYSAQAEDATYEEATELERAGAKIIELPKHRWEKIAC